MLLCPGGPHGPPRGGRPISAPPVAVHRLMNQCLLSNVMCTTIFAVDRISGCPENGRLSMPLCTIRWIKLSKTCPISKACQHVMSLIDLNISACSSECDQHILTASQSMKWALLHCERREVWMLTVNISWLSDFVTYMVILWLTWSLCDLHVLLLSEVMQLFKYVVWIMTYLCLKWCIDFA